MKIKKVAIVIILAVLISWLGWTNFNLETTHQTITSKKLPKDFDGFRIAHVSDLDSKNWGNTLPKKIANQKPDIIVITGDIIDATTPNLKVVERFLKNTKNIAPIYYVTGNNEATYKDLDKLTKILNKHNVNIMDNKSMYITHGKSRIKLTGIKDPKFIMPTNLLNKQDEYVLKELIDKVDNEYFNIVLCHRAEQFKQFVFTNTELAFTGHAHGGQIRLPLVGALIAPNQGFLPKYTEGVYHRKNTHMVVSRGLGNTIFPIRVNNMPELVIVTLKTNK